MVILAAIFGFLAGCAGFGLGVTYCQLWVVNPLTEKFIKLRYDGFRPEQPMPEHPKTVPMFQVRED